jgi:hypothetical protein
MVNYEEYYQVNICKGKPEGITDSDYGKFFRLLNLMSKRNKLIHKGNNRVIKKELLSELLGFKNIKSFYNFLNKLTKHRMIAESKAGAIKYIAVNPAYAQRRMALNSTIYRLFKEDLDEFLDAYQKKYFELYEDDVYLESIISIE